MAIPPPPPPGPPPPPVPKLNLGGGSSLGGGSNSGDSRNALLMSIQKGAKLKKTVTNDKSGPAIAGRVAGSTSGSSNNSSSGMGERRAGGPGGGTGGGTPNGGGPKLAGIFGGMSEMPKLKPVNRGGGNQSTLNRSPPRSNPVDQHNSSSSSISSNMNSSSNSSSSNLNGGGGALDFNAELTQHLTLKKKKQQLQLSTPPAGGGSGEGRVVGGNVTEANLKTNRGPPPQPPPPPKNPPAPPPINGIAANSSSLFGNSNGTAATSTNGPVRSQQPSVPSTPQPSTPGLQQEEIVSGSVSEMKRLLMSGGGTSPKPAPNFGKPNLAPKPPGSQLTPGGGGGGPGSKPTSPLLSPGGAALKATVSRHHSMRTPRSPPVAPPAPGGPVFPSQSNFGTMRAPPSQSQSQEAISSSAPAPPVNGRPIGRPNVAPPPRPPPNKPPPPPLRSVSNQNLPQMPLSTPTTNTLNSAASANNVSVLKEQLKDRIGNGSAISGGGSTPNVEKVSSSNGSVPPPLPPHRTCPAPPPPNASRQASNVSTSSSSVPPVPPQRHSSIRSVSQVDSVAPLVVKQSLNAMNNGGDTHGGRLSAINRIIVDLELKFADRFHNPTEFPKPGHFMKTEKSYPSLSRAKNEF